VAKVTKRWWSILTNDGKYTHQSYVLARSCRQLPANDKRLENGQGVIADGVVIDYFYETVEEVD
jgi:hypothetical protein